MAEGITMFVIVALLLKNDVTFCFFFDGGLGGCLGVFFIDVFKKIMNSDINF